MYNYNAKARNAERRPYTKKCFRFRDKRNVFETRELNDPLKLYNAVR